MLLEEKEKKEVENEAFTASVQPSCSSSSFAKQKSVMELFQKKTTWDKTSERSQALDKKIAEMIVLDDLPFSHVDDLGFRRVINEAVPRYDLRHRKFFTEKICTEIHPAVETVVQSHISKLIHHSKLSFTTDAWSDNKSGVSLLSLTCHGIDDNFERRHFVLNAEPLTERHTSEYLSSVFNSMLEKWHIKQKDVHCVMRDAGANIKKALLLSDVTNLDCFAHQLQLVVKEGVTAQKCVADLLVKCRAIATHFNHSSAAQAELEKIQIRLNLHKLSVVQDVPTRWNSSLHMLERTREINEAICVYASSHAKVKGLKAADSELLSCCIDILKPFDEITKNISSADSSIADVIPFVKTIKVMLNNIDAQEAGVLKTMKTKLLSEIDRRFESYQNNDTYAIATLLDPRYKSKFFDSHITHKVKISLAQQCQELEEADNNSPPRKKQKSKDASDAVEQSYKSVSTSMNILLASSSDEESGMEVESEIQQMLDDYLKIKRLDSKEDPLKWWKENCRKFPKLSVFARAYLSCPSSSVASERLFSGAGMIYDEKRCSLDPKKAQQLLFLKYNLPIIDFKY